MLSVLLIVALGVLKGRNLSTIDSDVWMPWIETQAWAPLQRLVAVTLFLAGAYLTFRVIGRHAVGRWRALALTLIAVSIFSVRGSAAGFVLCALVLWACHEYVDGPGPVGSWLLTILTVAISASRGEFGVYVALAAGAALVARHVQDGARALGGAALRFIGAIAVVTLLWVPFGQVLASLHRPGLSVVDRTLNVRWAPGVNAAEREAKEREHALPDGQPVTNEPSGRTWNYRWTGQAPASVRKLLNDPAVEDTKNIDRTTARYDGIGGSPDDDSEWMTALPFGASRAVVTAGTAAWWLWVLLPIAAAVGVIRSAIRPVSTHPGSRADLIVLPAIMLCLPIARLVVQGAGDLGPVAAPAMPALAGLTAWLLTGPFLRQPSEASEAAATWQRATRVRETTTARAREIYVCIGLTVLTVCLHLYLNTDVTNDHAGYLVLARQIVYGYWPIRDFSDDGALLQILLSAAVQKIGGFRLLGEMLLSWTFFAAANCLTYWLAFRLSGRRLAAITAAVLAALLIPRPYGYPKVFIYPLAILVLWRYVERPRTGRLTVVAATIAFAFLFRIDHGVVIAATSVVAVAAVHGHEWRTAVRQCLVLAGASLLFLLPQAAYITWSMGLPRYAESIFEFGAYGLTHREPWPVRLSVSQGIWTEPNAVMFLLNVSVLIAGVALIRAVVQLRGAWSRRTAPPRESLWILVVVVMWGLMLPMLARGQYYTRIAEVGQPVAILGAWLAVRWLAVDPTSPKRWTVLGALLATTVVALCCRTPMAAFFTQPDRIFGGAPFQAQILKELATSPPLDEFAPTQSTSNLRQLVRYAHECTNPDDRLAVTWFGPEVYFYAGRAFAGERWDHEWFYVTRDQARGFVETLRRQSAVIAFVEASRYAKFEQRWPAIAADLEASYRLVAEVPINEDFVTRVLVLNTRIPSRYVPFKKLPCFN